jgi:hypothetical protein
VPILWTGSPRLIGVEQGYGPLVIRRRSFCFFWVLRVRRRLPVNIKRRPNGQF